MATINGEAATVSSSELFANLTDTYARQARLYPALLAGAPLVAIAVGVYGQRLEPKAGLITLLASFGVIYLLTNVARELGKRIEEVLYASWGGKPTTQLLRHRDSTLDSVTKARYHVFLSTKLNVRFPTTSEEQADPGAADATYASAARWLLDQTRDTKTFPLLFKELIAYGFRRNCLGLKSIAIFIALLSLLWLLGATGVLTLSGFDGRAFAIVPMPARVVGGIDLVFLGIWVCFVSRQTVRTSAFMYADLLLRACDILK
jgi:branched-subunit amino acid ABC-type transport system permease component